jgi:putative component of toxin-antitoxin plasmid stabilization module
MHLHDHSAKSAPRSNLQALALCSFELRVDWGPGYRIYYARAEEGDVEGLMQAIRTSRRPKAASHAWQRKRG